MRRLIYLAAILLILALGPKAQTQVKLIQTQAPTEKARKLRDETRAINELLDKYNQVLREAGSWVNVPPEKALPLVQEIDQHFQNVEEIYLHYREVP
jgi:hypothetical protein